MCSLLEQFETASAQLDDESTNITPSVSENVTPAVSANVTPCVSANVTPAISAPPSPMMMDVVDSDIIVNVVDMPTADEPVDEKPVIRYLHFRSKNMFFTEVMGKLYIRKYLCKIFKNLTFLSCYILIKYVQWLFIVGYENKLMHNEEISFFCESRLNKYGDIAIC
jgi:hypothetical protein